MSYCSNCGAEVEGRFCAKCGTPVDSTSPPPSPGASPYSQPAPNAGLTNNIASALCYALGLISGGVLLLIAPYNQIKSVRFQAFQAIFFHLAWIVLIIAQTLLSLFLPWSLSVILSLFSFVIWLGGLVLWILLMVKAYNNERFKLPIIGDLAEKQA